MEHIHEECPNEEHCSKNNEKCCYLQTKHENVLLEDVKNGIYIFNKRII